MREQSHVLDADRNKIRSFRVCVCVSGEGGRVGAFLPSLGSSRAPVASVPRYPRPHRARCILKAYRGALQGQRTGQTAPEGEERKKKKKKKKNVNNKKH